MHMNVKIKLLVYNGVKLPVALWIAGQRNSLAKSFGLDVEQQTDLQVICAARNVRVQALHSTE